MMAQRNSPPTDAEQTTPADRKDGSIVSEEVPARPELAPSVELNGDMQESGFEDGQGLVQREGRFLQVPSLLFHLLEQVNGRRTVDEIATKTSEATGRPVSPENVRTLIAGKLIPRRLVKKADGSVEEPSDGEQRAPRSPLQIGMRTKVASPAVINPVTRVLQGLYWPPVAVTLLILTLAAQGWLFLIHGIARAAHQALYDPALMLVMLGVIIVATAFHELGHATALRYGGGQVRGMGVGLYLVYPAFYTDVTDNYRLGRWARVRTDLGGFYFNLIFALITLAAYWITKQDFLLLVIVYVDFEIIQQSLPFVRLDGYWALADLTGLPDFFSQIVPFLRTTLPLPLWGEGRKLPNLKPWVKAVFAAYILITVPLLVFLVLLMIISVPRVLATAWDSFHRLEHSLTAALGSGDALGAAAAAVQIVLLTLPTVGMFVVLFKLGRAMARLLWKWSSATPGRRALGSAAAVAAVALLALVWVPRVPLGGPNHTPVYNSASFRPIGPEERGTLIDALYNLPLLGGIVGAVAPPDRHPRHDPVPASMRRFPLLGGVIDALAPADGYGGIVDTARGFPILGGAIEDVAPRNGHGGLINSVRSVPVLGGVVNRVAPPARTAPGPSGQSTNSGGQAPPQPSGGSAPTPSAPGQGAGATSVSTPMPASTAPEGPGTASVPAPVSTAGAALTAGTGLVETPVSAVGTAVGGVQTPVAAAGTAVGAVQTPVAGAGTGLAPAPVPTLGP